MRTRSRFLHFPPYAPPFAPLFMDRTWGGVGGRGGVGVKFNSMNYHSPEHSSMADLHTMTINR